MMRYLAVLLILAAGSNAESEECVADPGCPDQCQLDVSDDVASLLQRDLSSNTGRLKGDLATAAAKETDGKLQQEKDEQNTDEHDEDEDDDDDEEEEEERRIPTSPYGDFPPTATLRSRHDGKCLVGQCNSGRCPNVVVDTCDEKSKFKSKVNTQDCTLPQEQWFFKGKELKVLGNERVQEDCMDYSAAKNQKWRLTPEGYLKTDQDDTCADYDLRDNNVYMHTCHGGNNQKWRLTPEGTLKTHHDDKCADYNTNNGNVYMHTCHGGNNQKWHMAPLGYLKSAHDGKCLDYNPDGGNVYMHGCVSNVYFLKCHGGANQKWRLTPEGYLKTDQDDTCADYNTNNGNVYMHTCHGGNNQKWYFDDSIEYTRRRCTRRRRKR